MCDTGLSDSQLVPLSLMPCSDAVLFVRCRLAPRAIVRDVVSHEFAENPCGRLISGVADFWKLVAESALNPNTKSPVLTRYCGV